MRSRTLPLMLVASLPGTVALAEPVEPITVMHATDSANNLLTIDVATGLVEQVGSTAGLFTDIAFSHDGRLFGVTSAYVYEIDVETGWSTLIGSHGFGVPGNFRGIDALTFGSDGNLYAAGDDTLITIDTDTGEGTLLGHLSGYRSAGDMAEDAAGRLLLTTDAGVLVEAFRDGSGAANIGEIPFDDVFALGGSADGNIYGVRSTGDILTLDTVTGLATVIGQIQADFLIGFPYGGSFATQFVPEPSTLALCACGLAICFRRRPSTRAAR